MEELPRSLVVTRTARPPAVEMGPFRTFVEVRRPDALVIAARPRWVLRALGLVGLVAPVVVGAVAGGPATAILLGMVSGFVALVAALGVRRPRVELTPTHLIAWSNVAEPRRTIARASIAAILCVPDQARMDGGHGMDSYRVEVVISGGERMAIADADRDDAMAIAALLARELDVPF